MSSSAGTRRLVCRYFEVAAALAIALTLVGCSKGIQSTPPGNTCGMNSDCATGLTCSFGRCQSACKEARDCPNGEQCVKDSSGINSCLLPASETCNYSSQCPLPLVCATDLKCRNQCLADRDCATATQKCVQPDGVCAEPSAINTNGGLQNAVVGMDAGVPGAGGVMSPGGSGGSAGSSGSSPDASTSGAVDARLPGAGGVMSAGGSGGSAGSSGSTLDPNAFGQRYKFSNNELPGWTQPTAAQDPTAFDVYNGGDELVSRLDGAADTYTSRGCRVSMFQDLVGPDPQICTVVAMDFVTNTNANSMFTYQASNGAYVAIPGYAASVALGSPLLAGMVAYAHFNALYFEVQFSGYADTTSASAVAAQFLNLLFAKTLGVSPDAGTATGSVDAGLSDVRVGGGGWDQARIGNTGVGWWVNAIKSAYFFSVKVSPSSQDDTAGRAAVIGFAQKVVGGLTSGTPAPATLVPLADPTSGWMLDQNSSKTASGVAVATDATSATALVDGAADPFYDTTKSYQAKGLAWEVYSNGTYSLDLKIWQMASATNAAQLYTDLLDNSLYSNITWTTCSETDPLNPCGTPVGGPAPVLVTVQPLVLDFGSVDVGQTSLTPSSVTVTNLGPATSLTPTIVQPSLFSLAGNTCNTLAAAGTCIISVSFTPTHTGPAAGTLVVAGSVMVSLTGSGSPPADFTQTDHIDLGTIPVGATVSGKVTVTATNALTDLLCSVSSAGNIKADPSTTTCPTAAPGALAKSASCTYGFTFSSATAGAKTGDEVICNAGSVTKITSITAVVTPTQPPI